MSKALGLAGAKLHWNPVAPSSPSRIHCTTADSPCFPRCRPNPGPLSASTTSPSSLPSVHRSSRHSTSSASPSCLRAVPRIHPPLQPNLVPLEQSSSTGWSEAPLEPPLPVLLAAVTPSSLSVSRRAFAPASLRYHSHNLPPNRNASSCVCCRHCTHASPIRCLSLYVYLSLYMYIYIYIYMCIYMRIFFGMLKGLCRGYVT